MASELVYTPEEEEWYTSVCKIADDVREYTDEHKEMISTEAFFEYSKVTARIVEHVLYRRLTQEDVQELRERASLILTPGTIH